MPSNIKGLVTTATVRIPFFARQFRHHRGRTGSGTATHAGGNEYHVRPVDGLGDAVAIFHRGLAPDIGIRPGTQALGQVLPELKCCFRQGSIEHLCVCIRIDEIHTVDTRTHHMINGVASTAANTDYLDYGLRAD